MIAKTPERGKRGADTRGLLGYLFGPGRANEHTDPHLVAAWDLEWLAGGTFAPLLCRRGGLAVLARDLDAAMTGHQVTVDGGHVYHVVLAVPPVDSNPRDGLFGDARWRELAESAIEHMSLGPDAEGAAGCRWVAVHHGVSAQGNDHLHLVVNVVRGDGRQAYLYQDWPRWRAWCLQVEDRYGLTRTAPAGEGRQQATTRPELERAKAAGRETERDRLRRVVSEAAAEAGSEAQFVAVLRAAGVLVAPHLTGGRVTGYAIAVDPALTGTGGNPVWFAGSALRRDLSLPRLRGRWDIELPQAIAEAVWNGEQSLDGLRPVVRHTGWWRSVTRLVDDAVPVLDAGLAEDPDDPVRWHLAVEQTADLVAVVIRAQPAAPPPQLERVHDQLTRAAQQPRGRQPPPARRGVTLPLLVQAARLAAVSREPAPLVLAGIVVALYILVSVLAQHAERRSLRAAAREQIRTATRELATHPAVQARSAADRITTPSPAGPVTAQPESAAARRQDPPASRRTR